VIVEIMPLDIVGIIGLKNAKVVIGSQIVVENLPFLQQNSKDE